MIISRTGWRGPFYGLLGYLLLGLVMSVFFGLESKYERPSVAVSVTAATVEDAPVPMMDVALVTPTPRLHEQEAHEHDHEQEKELYHPLANDSCIVSPSTARRRNPRALWQGTYSHPPVLSIISRSFTIALAPVRLHLPSDPPLLQGQAPSQRS